MTGSVAQRASTGFPRLLFVANVDWFFVSHRLALARAAVEAGYDVHVAAADTGRSDPILDVGGTFHGVTLSRSGRNPVHELRSLLALLRLYRTLRPDLLHHVSIKPIVYGSVAAWLRAPRATVLNAVSGLGTFIENDSRLARSSVLAAYRALFSRPRVHVIVQNEGHETFLTQHAIIAPERVHLIEGSGVDAARFRPDPDQRSDPPVIVLVARMLGDKGVREFIEAARIVRETVEARFVLVGPAGDDNPTAISAEELQSATAEGAVEWWGPRDDVEHVLQQASLFVSASYHEGLPKTLLEAGACGLPIVATDIPGHRGVIDANTGVLVPRADARSLADAISLLLDDPERAERLGSAVRHRVETRFTIEDVVGRTIALYASLLPKARSNAGS